MRDKKRIKRVIEFKRVFQNKSQTATQHRRAAVLVLKGITICRSCELVSGLSH